MRKRILNILFWSVLSAAFIGPGTITTAASAGTGYGYTLLWALLFSTVACIVLQEAAARLTIASGRNLGEAIYHRFKKSIPGKALIYLILIAILLGCAAYEAGNILGAVAGASLLLDQSTVTLTLFIGVFAVLLMWFGSSKLIAQTLGVVVAVMGICFVSTAVIMNPSLGELFTGLAIPKMPDGSELLVIGLIGTTVVPYNLFLGSGIKHTQNLKEMRVSLTAAILLGGIVSMAVLVVGSSISGSFSYEALAGTLSGNLGTWAAAFFGIGLCAAGISSALTAPLAAALTAQSILGNQNPNRWSEKGHYFRSTWMAVLLAGILFGVLQVQPIPAIILAQALNGIILPVVAIFLMLMVNDAGVLKPKHINSPATNLVTGLVVFTAIIIGVTNIIKALDRTLNITILDESVVFSISVVFALIIFWPVIKATNRYRST